MIRIKLLLAVILIVLLSGCGGCSKETEQKRRNELPARDPALPLITIPDWQMPPEKESPQATRLRSLPAVTAGESFQVEGTYRVRDADAYRREFAKRYAVAIRVGRQRSRKRFLIAASKSVRPVEEKPGVYRYRQAIPAIRKPGRYTLRVECALGLSERGKTVIAEGALQVRAK